MRGVGVASPETCAVLLLVRYVVSARPVKFAKKATIAKHAAAWARVKRCVVTLAREPKCVG